MFGAIGRFIKRLFVWWEGFTIGTWLWTLVYGEKVGKDGEGNTYYQTKDSVRRWVLYKGEAEASRVPPEWHRWLHHTTDVPPSIEPPKQKPWEKPHLANPTGTGRATYPKGSLANPAPRQKATGDYEPWRPKAK